MRTAKQQNAVKLTSQGSGAQTVPGKSQEENVCESVNGRPPLSSVLFLRRRPVSVRVVDAAGQGLVVVAGRVVLDRYDQRRGEGRGHPARRRRGVADQRPVDDVARLTRVHVG